MDFEMTLGEGGQAEITGDLPDPLKGLENLIDEMLHLPAAEPEPELEAG